MNARSFGRPSLWFAAIVLAVLAVALLAMHGEANAAPRAITGGHLNWGVKESFRNYVEGPIALGSINMTTPRRVIPTGRSTSPRMRPEPTTRPPR